MSEQLTLWPDDEIDSLKGDKRLTVLGLVDIGQFIPREVNAFYYLDTGRPPFSLESMLLALLAQKILKIPTIELLITVLELSPSLRRFCGFFKAIPDESTFCRFKQRLGPENFKKILAQLAEETSRLLAQENKDPFAQKLLLVDTTGLKVPVKENNPKYFTSLKKKTEKQTPKKPDAEIYYRTLAKMPKRAKSEPRAKLTYANGHWCYNYTAALVTDGFGLIQDVILMEGCGDAVTIKPLFNSFKEQRDISKYAIFVGDAGFDSTAVYRFLVEECSLKPVIPVNPRNSKGLLQPGFTEHGVPLCPKDHSLTMKPDGFCKGRNRIKWRCPLLSKSKGKYHLGCSDPCTNSRLGRMVYTYPKNNYRFHTLIPRNSKLWRKAYSFRYRIEQTISRIKCVMTLGSLTVSNFDSVYAELCLSSIAQQFVSLAAIYAKRLDLVQSVRKIVA